MNARRFWLSVIVPILLCVGFFAQSGTTIEGIVLDAAVNEPLVGVQVMLYPSEPPIAVSPREAPLSPPQAITDGQGRFSIQTNQTGRFRIVPIKPSFVFLRSRGTRPLQLPGLWVELSANSRIAGIQLRMTRPAAISGTVLDPTGRPNSALAVGLLSYTYRKDGKRVLDNVPGVTYRGANSWHTTNDRGEFRLYDLPPGEYYLAFLGDNRSVIPPGPSYYPGVADEAKAVPIQVASGVEVKLGTITLPVRPNPVELRLHITGPPQRPLRAQVQLGNDGRLMTSPSNSAEIGLQVVPGHYEIMVSDSGTSLQGDYYYERLAVDVGGSNSVYDVVLKRGAKLTSTMVLENALGERSPSPSILCRIDGRSNRDCLQSTLEHGPHSLEFQGLPRDAYVLSAKVGDDDILANGLNIVGDTQLEIVLAQPGAIVYGTVRDNAGDGVPDATVVLVPDAPYRSAAPRYRSVITDHKGQFEIHGIAPASYKLFAWSEMEGTAYLNPDFLKVFEERGKPLEIQKGTRQAMDLIAF